MHLKSKSSDENRCSKNNNNRVLVKQGLHCSSLSISSTVY